MADAANAPPLDLATIRANYKAAYSSIPIPDGVGFVPVEAEEGIVELAEYISIHI